MTSIWKDIENYEGYYQVSNEGTVRGLDRIITGGGNQPTKKIKGRLLKSHVKRNGYLQVRLTKNGKTKDFLVHRLVAQTFISNPENLPQVNHIDGDKTNNNVENLEWCDTYHNMKHARSLDLVNNEGENSPNSVYTEDQILLVKSMLRQGYKYKQITERTGVTRHTIYKVKNRKQWDYLNED